MSESISVAFADPDVEWELVTDAARDGIDEIPDKGEREHVEKLLDTIDETSHSDENPEFKRTDWVRIINAGENGLKQIDGPNIHEEVDELLDDIVGQTKLCFVDLIELNASLKYQGSA